MKRLSSDSVYFSAFGFPFIIAFAVIAFWTNISNPKESIGSTIFIFIIFLSFISFAFYLSVIKSKRIFYSESSIYAYNLFSKKFIHITKDELRYVGRFFFFDPRFWKIVYYDQNGNLKSIYFIKSMLLDDFDEIVDELNY